MHKPARIVLVLTALAAALYVFLAVEYHRNFFTHGHDLGIFDQAIWQLSRFETPASTIRKIPVPNIFGDHFHPIILVFVPLYWIAASPYTLVIVQALLLAAVLPLTYLLARQMKIGPWPAVLIAAAAGFHPGLLATVQFDFHEIAFAPALLLAAALLAERRQWKWFWICLALLLLTKESMAIYAALLGLMLLFRHRKKVGWWTIGVSVVYFLIVTKLIIPGLAPDLGYAYFDQYRQLGSSPLAWLLEFIRHPWTFVRLLFDQPGKAETMKWMFGSFAFLPLLSWTTWPLVLATLAERFWSNAEGLWRFQFHYQAVMVAIFVLAALYALRDWTRWFPATERFAPLISLTVLGATLWVYGAWGGQWKEVFIDPGRRASWEAAIRRVPPSAAVSAQDAFVPHLAERPIIYQFPRIRQAGWIILDPQAPSWPLSAEEISVWQDRLRRSADWQVVEERGSLTLFTGRAASEALPMVSGWQ